MEGKETRILLLTHGGWGMHLVKAAEMILGKIECCDEIPLKPEYTFQDYCELIDAYTEKVSQNSLVISDLFGGSTTNAALKVCYPKQIRVLTGLSAPLLIEACSQLQFQHEFNMEQLCKVGHESCHDVIEEMKRKMGN